MYAVKCRTTANKQKTKKQNWNWMELKIDFKWTQMDANGMFKMSAERHEIIITGWHITRKTIKSLKKGVH